MPFDVPVPERFAAPGWTGASPGAARRALGAGRRRRATQLARGSRGESTGKLRGAAAVHAWEPALVASGATDPNPGGIAAAASQAAVRPGVGGGRAKLTTGNSWQCVLTVLLLELTSLSRELTSGPRI